MTAKYEKALSPKGIMALARRNHIVKDILDSLGLNEESNIAVWHKGLTVMVSELVEYCERVMIERYDQYLSGADQNEKSLVEINDKNYNRESVLRLAKTNLIVNQCLNGSLNSDRTIDWENALIMATVHLVEHNAMLAKQIEEIHVAIQILEAIKECHQ